MSDDPPNTPGVFVRSVLVFIVVALATAFVQLATNEWFGASDLYSFAVFTVGFGVPLGVVGILVRGLLGRLHWLPRVLAAAIGGAAAGFVCTFIAGIVLGAWIGAFSFNVALAWLVAGASSSAAAAATVDAGEPRRWRRDALVVLATALAFGVVLPFGLHFASNEQQVEIIVLKRAPSGSGTEVGGFDGRIGAVDVELLRNAGVTNASLTASSRSGRDQRRTARILFVQDHALDTSVELALPFDTTVVYVQEGDGFRVYPPDARMSDQTFEVTPAGSVIHESVQLRVRGGISITQGNRW